MDMLRKSADRAIADCNAVLALDPKHFKAPPDAAGLGR